MCRDSSCALEQGMAACGGHNRQGSRDLYDDCPAACADCERKEC